MEDTKNTSGRAGLPHLKTGLYVRSAAGLRLRDEKVRRLVRRMRIAMPWLEDCDEPTARAWAQLEVLADMAHTMLRREGIVNQEGQTRRLLGDFRSLRAVQLQYARQLGMSPASRAEIKIARENEALDIATQCALDRARGEPDEELDVPSMGAEGVSVQANGIPDDADGGAV